MPIISVDRAIEIAESLLQGAGAPENEAKTVAWHVINANLSGHDSHGIIQIPTYIERVLKGDIVPGAKWEIIQESPTTTVVDGHWGFGYVANERAMKYTIEKAKTQNVAAATVFRQGHIGRLASYPLMAAREGMIALITADSGRGPKHVAPFGGREKRLGTNPISIAMPSNLEGPFFIDMASSAVAAGKINLALARDEKIPGGWIIDKCGQNTTSPIAFKEGGALLPLGGSEGYKGYGLSAMIEIFSGILTGLGHGVEPTGRHNDGCFMAVFKVEAFRPLETFKREVSEFAEYLKNTMPAEGFDEVLYPGEIEHKKEVARRRDGIEVENSTWNKLIALADEYDMRDRLEI
ncbi:MAG: dehydrogenase [Rhodospirillaceae bacterium]|nr:dehydrogenase [Rhodospirillaceae bacterium]